MSTLCSTFRHCNEECVLRGVHFGKGVNVLVAISTLHYNPQLWVDPQTFNPERLATFHMIALDLCWKSMLLNCTDPMLCHSAVKAMYVRHNTNFAIQFS